MKEEIIKILLSEKNTELTWYQKRTYTEQLHWNNISLAEKYTRIIENDKAICEAVLECNLAPNEYSAQKITDLLGTEHGILMAQP